MCPLLRSSATTPTISKRLTKLPQKPVTLQLQFQRRTCKNIFQEEVIFYEPGFCISNRQPLRRTLVRYITFSSNANNAKAWLVAAFVLPVAVPPTGKKASSTASHTLNARAKGYVQSKESILYKCCYKQSVAIWPRFVLGSTLLTDNAVVGRQLKTEAFAAGCSTVQVCDATTVAKTTVAGYKRNTPINISRLGFLCFS